VNTEALSRAEDAMCYLLLDSPFDFKFTKTKHMICKTTSKYGSMVSLDTVSEWVVYRYVEINLVQEKKLQLKKTGDVTRRGAMFLKVKKPSKCICFSVFKLIDAVDFLPYLFTLDVNSRLSAESSPKWKSWACPARDL